MQWDFTVGERDWAQLQMQHGQVGFYCQGAELGSVDRKLLGGTIRAKGASSSTNQIGFLLKTGQGDQTSPGGWWRVRNLIRYQGCSDSEGGASD